MIPKRTQDSLTPKFMLHNLQVGLSLRLQDSVYPNYCHGSCMLTFCPCTGLEQMAAASSGLKQLHLKPVHHLYVTLRRSFAGTPKRYEAILKSLGFSYRQQTLCLPNSVSTRGQISKVSSQPA